MLPMTNDLRREIKMRNKNKIDISDLIFNVDIKGEDLSFSIIKNFNRIKENLSNIKFDYATIGEEGKVTNLSNSNFRGSSFVGTKFLGIVLLRRCNCRDCNFNGAYLDRVQYQYSDFTNSTFCEALIRVGTDYGYKAIFDENFFRDLSKYWLVEVRRKTPEEIKELEKLKESKDG